MLEGKFLGIDESESPNFPQAGSYVLVVGVVSSYEPDLFKNQIKKKRKATRDPPWHELRGREYHLLRIPADYHYTYGHRGIIAISLVECIANTKGPERVIVDGNLWPQQVAQVHTVLGPEYEGVSIVGEDRADRRYPLVNRADNLAHFLVHLAHIPVQFPNNQPLGLHPEKYTAFEAYGKKASANNSSA